MGFVEIARPLTAGRPGAEIPIGTASEAWVLCGFDPAHPAEKQRLKAAQKQAGLDPITRSHDLTSTTPGPRDAKSICLSLLGEPPESPGGRGERCWMETDLAILERRGAHNGLAALPPRRHRPPPARPLAPHQAPLTARSHLPPHSPLR